MVCELGRRARKRRTPNPALSAKDETCMGMNPKNEHDRKHKELTQMPPHTFPHTLQSRCGTHIHTHKFTHTHTYTHACTHTNTHAHTYSHTPTCIHTHTHKTTRTSPSVALDQVRRWICFDSYEVTNRSPREISGEAGTATRPTG